MQKDVIDNEQGCIFWGKFSPEVPKCLPLAAHCLDVAVVFRSLCDLNGVRRSLESTTEEAVTDQQLDRLAVLAMLHDVGKANLGFQRKVFDPKTPRAGHIRELAPLLDGEALDEELHEAFIEALPSELQTWFGGEESAYSYLMASFSHHGRPLQFKGEMAGTYWQARKEWWCAQGRWDPMAAIAEIANWSRKAFPLAFQEGSLLPNEPPFHHRFAGLVMLADWLGSHSNWFPIEQASLDERLEHGRAVVPRLLRDVGLDSAWLRPQLASGLNDFEARFKFKPRPLQTMVDQLNPDDDNTRLVIAESETGSGKTEAALNWFFKLFAGEKADGLYFALPTRVAARELYKRVQAIIERWFPDPNARPVTVLAVPGYAQVDGIPVDRLLPSQEIGKRWHDDELSYRERCWAAERPKRFLAATIAVGTIDQALLSVVQTAHAHLRSVCLDRNLLVVDEVHASDFYMSRLLEFLLKHHLGVGGRAMLLSATLGARARYRYTGRTRLNGEGLCSVSDAEKEPYPAITLADGKLLTVQSSPEAVRHVHFEAIPFALQLEAVAKVVITALGAKARVLVIMNTVDRANALLRSVEANNTDPGWLFACRGVICPHHGRFAPEDRLLLDAQVSERFGPESIPGPVLLVGTQTLEQSLDIDADLLITDLAPADVLLQRVGRLHRHARPLRPAGYETPHCFVLVPNGDLEGALDQRGEVKGAFKRLGYGSVYEDLRALELTRQALLACPQVGVPTDNRRLVEAVTHPEKLASLAGAAWKLHGQLIEGGELAQAIAAGNAAAIFDKHFGDFDFNELGGKVAVRLGADSLQLPLDHPLISPFEQRLESIVIPGHMAPRSRDEVVKIEEELEDRTILTCGDHRYCYSRYGLERQK